MCLCSSVYVGPVRKPHCWFSHEVAHLVNLQDQELILLNELRREKTNILHYGKTKTRISFAVTVIFIKAVKIKKILYRNFDIFVV